MKKLVLKTVIFATLISAIILFGTFFLYHKIEHGNYYKLEKNYDYLFFGHSHTAASINDTIIKSARNLSNSGEGMFYTYFKVKKIVENNKINTIFLSFTNNYINFKTDSIEIFRDRNINRWGVKYTAFMDFNDFSLLMKNNPKSIIATQPLSVKKYLSFLLKGNKNMIKDFNWGSHELVNKCKVDSLLKIKSNKDITKKQFKYSIYELQYFDKIISLCNKHKIKLCFIRCPVHKEWDGLENEIYFQRLVKNRFKTISFLDFKNFPLQNKYFADLHHINHAGSTIFCSFFNDLLAKGLLQKPNKQEFINQEMNKLNFK